MFIFHISGAMLPIMYCISIILFPVTFPIVMLRPPLAKATGTTRTARELWERAEGNRTVWAWGEAAHTIRA